MANVWLGIGSGSGSQRPRPKTKWRREGKTTSPLPLRNTEGGVRFEFEFGRVAVSDHLGEVKGSAQLVVWPMCGLACAPDSGLGHESEGLGCWEAKPSVKVTKVP